MNPHKGLVRAIMYNPSQASLWNDFVATSKNGLFLFDRSYMDYHSDRFDDHSLLFWSGEKLVGLMPASVDDGVMSSHGGLTFGGVVTDQKMRTGTMLEVMAAVRFHMLEMGIQQLIYKAVPHIYHQTPAEEDLYALFVHGARLVRRDVSSTIDLRARLAYAKGRKWSTSRARANHLDVEESRDFREFMHLEAHRLLEKYDATPTHSGDELDLLAARFPQNIRLFTARREGALLGGVVIFQSSRVAHAQYIASDALGRELGALDAIMDYLLQVEFANGPAFFDFGISTELAGTHLNAGLIENKESYGARATVHDFYALASA